MLQNKRKKEDGRKRENGKHAMKISISSDDMC